MAEASGGGIDTLLGTLTEGSKAAGRGLTGAAKAAVGLGVPYLLDNKTYQLIVVLLQLTLDCLVDRLAN